MAYKNGFRAGYRAGQAEPSLPPALWQHMLVLVHPDHHEGSSLHPMAAEVTRWLLIHRPRASAEVNQWGNRPVCVEQSRSAPMPAMPRLNANSYWPRSDTALDRLHS